MTTVGKFRHLKKRTTFQHNYEDVYKELFVIG